MQTTAKTTTHRVPDIIKNRVALIMEHRCHFLPLRGHQHGRNIDGPTVRHQKDNFLVITPHLFDDLQPLPVNDQDHGPEHSEFVDFFATYKATLPAIGRLMKVCRARVVPLFPIYDGKTHRLTIQVRPPMDDLLEADDHTIARRMNEEVEIFVGPRPEQYTWILKLLKTRKPGEIQPYKRKDLYPINFLIMEITVWVVLLIKPI